MGDIHRFIVELEIPDGVSITHMTEEIQKAVVCISGYHTKEHPLFYIDKESIKTVHATRVRLENAWRKLKEDNPRIKGW